MRGSLGICPYPRLWGHLEKKDWDNEMNHSSIRRAFVTAALTLAVVTVGACGGDSDAGGATKQSTTTKASEESTTSTTESTTTVAPRAPADEATKALAQAGTLQLADFGEGWSEYAAGGTWTPTDESCGYRAAGGPEDDLLDGSVLNGPTVQLGDVPGYASSRTYVFPTEADAIAWVEISKSDEWAQCKQEGAQEFQDGNETGLTVSLTTREIESLGENGFESYAQFDGKNADDETEISQRMYIYRVGRTVVVETDELAHIDDADFQKYVAGTNAAINAAYERINALG